MGSIRSIEDHNDLLIGSAELIHETARIGTAERPLPSAESHASVPPWLWWNILSLDAPAVAVVWALLFARASHVEVPAATTAALALVVWVIYLADRLFDGWSAIDSRLLKERHRFCQRHRVAVSTMGILGAVAGVWLAYKGLNAAEVRAGLILAGLVGAYMLCVHLGGSAASHLFPKEIAVGLLFAAGTALPIWSQPRAFSWDGLFSWLLFALICILNCVAIECWEDQVAVRNTETARSRLVNWAASRIAMFAAGTALLGIAGLWLLHSDSNAIAAAGTAALLILLLNSARPRLSRHAIRVLADAALLIPAVLALLVRR
ncbi:MAG TPA: hypothetical protein VJS43_17295 [Candidatus Acidoferrales bacterium]|nr:hypothetical protein [Candidatus Acidoferrales bacterium]